MSIDQILFVVCGFVAYPCVKAAILLWIKRNDLPPTDGKVVVRRKNGKQHYRAKRAADKAQQPLDLQP
jgi:hypothetical protein